MKLSGVRLMLVLLLGPAAMAWSASAQSTNVAEVRFGGWLDALNSGDHAIYEKFLQANYPDRLTRIDKDLAFRSQMSGYEFLKIEESTATKCVALMQERDTDTILRATTEVAATEPHNMVSIAIRWIPRPADIAIARMT